MLAVLAVLAGIVLFSYLVSGGMEEGAQGYVHRLVKFIPLQTVKIVIVAWQVLTQVNILAVYARVRRHVVVEKGVF